MMPPSVGSLVAPVMAPLSVVTPLSVVAPLSAVPGLSVMSGLSVLPPLSVMTLSVMTPLSVMAGPRPGHLEPHVRGNSPAATLARASGTESHPS